MVQILDYNNILSHLKDNLELANTTTANYDLSTGLDKRIKTITDEDLTIDTTFSPSYPAISVRFSAKDEEQTEDIAGGKFNKQIDIFYEITLVHDAYTNSEDSLWKMIRNVETNLRSNSIINKYKKDGFNVSYIIPFANSFVENINEEDVFNKSAIISVLIRGHLKDS